MRLIQTLVPEGKHAAVVDILESEQMDFAMTEESSDSTYSDIVYIPADSEQVEEIVDRLRDVGVEREGYMVISDVETIVSEQFEQQQASAEEASSDDRISRDELRTKAQNLSRSTTNYLALTIISAIVATAGLLEDSAAVVVGSMVIAPLIGPAMASCVGTVINDDELFWEGIRSQTIGLAVAVLSAVVFAVGYRLLLAPELELLLIQQIAERAHPGLLALAIALGAGIAGALSLTSGADEALVGVMIAVALMPPAASVGLGIAYVEPRLAFGASVLLMVNLLSINTAGIITVWIKRYKPSHWYDAQQARQISIKRLVVFGLAILLLSSFLAMSSLDARNNMVFETQVEEITEQAADSVLTVDFAYRADLVTQQPSGITVYVHSEEPPTASELREQIREETDVDVPVTVITEQADVA